MEIKKRDLLNIIIIIIWMFLETRQREIHKGMAVGAVSGAGAGARSPFARANSGRPPGRLGWSHPSGPALVSQPQLG